MSAPKVRLVHDETGSFSQVDRPEKVHVVHGVVPGSIRAPGPLLIAEGAKVAGDVDARGAVHLARGASVGGNVRAMGDVILGAGSSVFRGVRAEGKVVVQGDATVTGELDAAGDVHLKPRSRVGTLLAGGDLHVHQPVLAPRVRVRGSVYVDRT